MSDTNKHDDVIFDHTNHVKLWDAIVEELKDIKSIVESNEYYDENLIPDDIHDLKEFILRRDEFEEVYPAFGCFACEYDKQLDGDPCENCPLEIMKCIKEYYDEESEYSALVSVYTDGDYDSAIEMAIKIRDAKVRKGVKTK